MKIPVTTIWNLEKEKPDLENIEIAIRLILESGYFVEDASKRLIEGHLRTLVKQPNIRKILELPCQAYGSLTQSDQNKGRLEGGLDKTNVVTICTAIGIVGWAAWTAADRIRDNESVSSGTGGPSDDLYIFSILRPIIDELIGRLSLPTIYLKRLKQAIGMMEYANSSHCALGVREKSSWKSMGAAIPLLALMMKVGVTGAKASEMEVLNRDIALCEDFFYYFILARQLSDDALDWKEDASKGKVSNQSNDTLVVKWLEGAFEEQVKYKIAAEMLKKSKRAIENARNISCFTDTGFLEELPRYYEEMAERILQKQPISSSPAHP
jgi:hypothetical protein